MRFKYKNKLYEVYWARHRRTARGDLTVCFIGRIVRGKSAEREACGEARCASEDQYCKERGRKLSLARALQNMKMPKNWRRHIWEIYLNRGGFPKEKGPRVSVPESVHGRQIKAIMFFRSIDYALLRKQKRLVHGLSHMSVSYHKHLCGIVHLLDALQDAAVKTGLSENEVFGKVTKRRRSNVRS